MNHYSFNLDSPFRIVITHSRIWIMHSYKVSKSCLPVKALPGKENQESLYKVPFCCPYLIHPKDFKANQLRTYSCRSLNLGSWDSSKFLFLNSQIYERFILFLIWRMILEDPPEINSSVVWCHELDQAWTESSNRCHELEAELQGWVHWLRVNSSSQRVLELLWQRSKGQCQF